MQRIAIGDRVIELPAGLVHHSGSSNPLSPRLHTLLKHVIEHPDAVISRDVLIEAVWGHLEAATDDSVNVAVSSLRQAIGDARARPQGCCARRVLRVRRVVSGSVAGNRRNSGRIVGVLSGPRVTRPRQSKKSRLMLLQSRGSSWTRADGAASSSSARACMNLMQRLASIRAAGRSVR